MRSPLFALPLLLALGAASAAEAQEFSLRAGADVRPLVGYNTNIGTGVSIGDVGYLGIHVVPSLKLAKIVSVELGLEPLIPISGGPSFAFLMSPGVNLDLQLVYVRAAIPVAIQSVMSVFFEGAVGISFVGHGYVGALIDYDTNGLFMVGAEAGWKF